MVTRDRPTCVCNRLSAFEVVQRLSAPAGRCSSALMSRCTLASRGSSRSLHSSKRAAIAVVLMGLVHVMELFRDLRRGTTPRCPLSGCLSSVACRVRSVRRATALLMSDGAIQVSTGILLVFVCFRHPVIILQVPFSVASSFFAWVEENKGKLTALSKLREGNFPELYSVVGEETATLEDLLKTGQTLFAALYGQSKCASLNVVRYTIYTKRKGKPPLVKLLPPTDKNLLLHMLRAHQQTMFWKAAYKQVAPAIVITDFGWEMLNSIPSPVIASGPPAPPELMKVISCQCRAAGKACAQGIRM